MELAAAHVHRVHANDPALQEHLREAAGRGPHVHRHPSARIDAQGVQGPLELDRAPPDVLGSGDELHRGPVGHRVSRLARGGAVDAHPAGHHEGLRLLP